jgi:hypothetical protein
MKKTFWILTPVFCLGLVLTSCGDDSKNKDADKNKETKAEAKEEVEEEERRPGPELGMHFEQDGEDEFGVSKNLIFATTENGTIELGTVQGEAAEVEPKSYKDFGIPTNAKTAIGVRYMHEMFIYAIEDNGKLKVYVGSPAEIGGKVKEWNEIRPELIGRWEAKEDDNFWAYYDLFSVYGDGNEEGTSYQIKGNQITYGLGADASVMKIVKLTSKEFTISYPDGSSPSTWVKADF